MRTKLWVGLLVCAWAGPLRADVLHLSTQQEVRGRVLGFSNATFEVQTDDRGHVRLAAAAVQQIEFAEAAARFETHTRGTVTGTVNRYAKGVFSLKTTDGKLEQVSATMVKNATFSSGGKDVDHVRGGNLEKYLVTGQVTIVDFYADWCGPCRRIGPFLENLAKQDDDVVLRKVNVDQNQALARKYGVNGIPHIMIFDKHGKLAGTVVGASEQLVTQKVNKAKGTD